MYLFFTDIICLKLIGWAITWYAVGNLTFSGGFLLRFVVGINIFFGLCVGFETWDLVQSADSLKQFLSPYILFAEPCSFLEILWRMCRSGLVGLFQTILFLRDNQPNFAYCKGFMQSGSYFLKTEDCLQLFQYASTVFAEKNGKKKTATWVKLGELQCRHS